MKSRLIPTFFLLLFLAGCGQAESPVPTEAAESTERPLIVASNFPLSYFAQRIAGDSVEVVFPYIDGDPAFWQPDADQIALLQSADLVLLNGAGYESWLDWVSLREDRLLDTSAAFQDRLIPLQQETVHQHGPSGEHSHAGMAFTVWLDPELAVLQAQAVEQAMGALVPDQAQQYETRLADLQADLERLDARLENSFQASEGQVMAFSHPVYQYLERRYGLSGFSMHWEPDGEPGVRDWIDFRDALGHYPASLMLWEDQPLPATSESLEAMGIRTVVFDPLGNAAPGSDYFELMGANIVRLGQ